MFPSRGVSLLTREECFLDMIVVRRAAHETIYGEMAHVDAQCLARCHNKRCSNTKQPRASKPMKGLQMFQFPYHQMCVDLVNDLRATSKYAAKLVGRKRKEARTGPLTGA